MYSLPDFMTQIPKLYGKVFNIQHFSIHDGPGIRTTVFLKGCPLHCKWCHNPESISQKKEIILYEERCIRCGACVEVCTTGAVHRDGDLIVTKREICTACAKCVEVCYAEARNFVGKELSTEDVINEIVKDLVFYDQSGGGVTFSGGEPLLQYDFLTSILKFCKNQNIHTAIDTCGFASPEIIDMISQYTDLFLYDIKIPDTRKHEEFTGVPNKLIHHNLQRLVKLGKEIIVRIPLIPEVNDDVKTIKEIGRLVESMGNIKEIHILPYHSTGKVKYARLGIDYSLKDLELVSQEKLEICKKELSNFVPRVEIE